MRHQKDEQESFAGRTEDSDITKAFQRTFDQYHSRMGLNQNTFDYKDIKIETNKKRTTQVFDPVKRMVRVNKDFIPLTIQPNIPSQN